MFLLYRSLFAFDFVSQVPPHRIPHCDIVRSIIIKRISSWSKTFKSFIIFFIVLALYQTITKMELMSVLLETGYKCKNCHGYLFGRYVWLEQKTYFIFLLLKHFFVDNYATNDNNFFVFQWKTVTNASFLRSLRRWFANNHFKRTIRKLIFTSWRGFKYLD